MSVVVACFLAYLTELCVCVCVCVCARYIPDVLMTYVFNEALVIIMVMCVGYTIWGRRLIKGERARNSGVGFGSRCSID